MKILLAFDKFKGSLSAHELCEIVAEQISTSTNWQIKKRPLADGGDGTLDILKHVFDYKLVLCQTLDPLARTIKAEYLRHEDTAFVELAQASGIVHLNKSELNVMKTSTLGTGILIKDAIDNGAKEIVFALGGSCTHDVGLGILAELGFQFLDENENHVQPKGGNLLEIKSIKSSEVPQEKFTILCDVENPLYGPRGAAHVYGPQKGATEKDIRILEEGVKHVEKLIEKITGKVVGQMEGAGSAGGIAAGLFGLLPDVEIKRGIVYLDQLLDIEGAIREADLVISGEGKLDSSSFDGKVIDYLLGLCKKHGVPLHVIAGSIEVEESVLKAKGISSSVALVDYAMDLETAISNPEPVIIEAVKILMTRF